MDIEFILNDALNKALCRKGRIQNPNSNTIAEFVNKYLQNKEICNGHCSLQLKDKEEITFEEYLDFHYDKTENEKVYRIGRDLFNKEDLLIDYNKVILNL